MTQLVSSVLNLFIKNIKKTILHWELNPGPPHHSNCCTYGPAYCPQKHKYTSYSHIHTSRPQESRRADSQHSIISADQHKKVCIRANRPLRSFWMPCFSDPAKNTKRKKRATGENCLRPLPAPSKSHAHREGMYGPWVRTRLREALLGILPSMKQFEEIFNL